jgi:phosphoglycerate dehydrogenase-like enzyme
MLHLAAREPADRVWIEPFVEELSKLGELEIHEHALEVPEAERAALARTADVLLTSWGATRVPESIADDPGRLKYVCHLNGSVRHTVPRSVVAAGIPVTNWGDAPANRLAEAAFTLLLAVLKDIPGRVDSMRAGESRPDTSVYGGTLEGLDVGIYGLGVIGRRFEEMLRPFRPNVRVYDPYVQSLPNGCARVSTLTELFERSFAVIIHAGLSDETRKSVTEEHLSLLPDHGILINTARGAIVDQEALFSELESGRLRAGLDVLDPDGLPPHHPARQWPNVILTAHDLGKIRSLPGNPPSLWKFHRHALGNLRRFLAGETLDHVVTLERYDRST